MRKFTTLVVLAVFALALFASLIGGVSLAAPSEAPLAAPTPISAPALTGSGTMVNLLSAQRYTTSTAQASNYVRIDTFALADIEYSLDMSGTNTTTLKLQWSNSAVNWFDGPTLASAVTADSTGLNQYNLFGRYVRAVTDLTTASATKPVTVSIWLNGKK